MAHLDKEYMLQYVEDIMLNHGESFLKELKQLCDKYHTKTKQDNSSLKHALDDSSDSTDNPIFKHIRIKRRKFTKRMTKNDLVDSSEDENDIFSRSIQKLRNVQKPANAGQEKSNAHIPAKHNLRNSPKSSKTDNYKSSLHNIIQHNLRTPSNFANKDFDVASAHNSIQQDLRRSPKSTNYNKFTANTNKTNAHNIIQQNLSKLPKPTKIYIKKSNAHIIQNNPKKSPKLGNTDYDESNALNTTQHNLRNSPKKSYAEYQPKSYELKKRRSPIRKIQKPTKADNKKLAEKVKVAHKSISKINKGLKSLVDSVRKKDDEKRELLKKKASPVSFRKPKKGQSPNTTQTKKDAKKTLKKASPKSMTFSFSLGNESNESMKPRRRHLYSDRFDFNSQLLQTTGSLL